MAGTSLNPNKTSSTVHPHTLGTWLQGNALTLLKTTYSIKIQQFSTCSKLPLECCELGWSQKSSAH